MVTILCRAAECTRESRRSTNESHAKGHVKECHVRDEELTSVIDEVRQRVRARYPEQPLESNPTYPLGPALPDLMPLLHARDAAEG